jgi:DNA replication protein DnaC
MEGVDEMLQRMAKAAAEKTPAEWEDNDRRVREEESAYLREAAREERRREAARVASLQIPALALKDAQAPLRDTSARAALQDARGFVVLIGGVGCGKTVAAAEWLLGRKWGLWVSAIRLARWPRYDDAEVRKLTMAHSLVIDDLGREFLDEKGSFLALFDELVDERHQASRPTVATANMTAEAFVARYGERTVSRIRQAGAVVNVDGADMRKEA